MSGTLIQKWSIGINRIDLYSNGINTYIDGIGHAFAWPVGYPNVERSYYQSTKDLGYGGTYACLLSNGIALLYGDPWN
jgi:hypothetical protein